MKGVIQTARRGYNARRCHPRFRTIDSTKNQLKEYMSGGDTVSFSKPSLYVNGRTIVEITHNLGYQPFVLVWFRISGEDTWVKTLGYTTVSVSGDTVYIVGAIGRPNNNTLQICFYTDIMGPATTQNIDYKYVIYLDPYKDAWS